MTLEVIVGGTAVYPLATNTGWGNVVRFIASIKAPARSINALRHLARFGWVEPRSALINEIQRVLPLADGDVKSTLQGLLEFCQTHEGLTVVVTNGVGQQ